MGEQMSHLGKNEKLIFKTKGHWKSLIIPIFLASHSTMSYIAYTRCEWNARYDAPNMFFKIYNMPYEFLSYELSSKFTVYLMQAGIIVGALWSISRIIKLLTSTISLSDKKLMGKSGLIKTKTLDVKLDQISSLSVERKLGGRILGYGTIIVKTSSDVSRFDFVNRAEDYKHTIFNEIARIEESLIDKSK